MLEIDCGTSYSLRTRGEPKSRRDPKDLEDALKKLMVTIVPLVLLAGAAVADVWVFAPGDNWTVSSPMHVNAQGVSNYPVTAIAVYVDQQLAGLWNQASIDTYINMSGGQHAVVVQSWDVTGAVSVHAMNVYISGSSNTQSSTAGSSSSTGNYYDIDQMTGWDSCSGCANRVFQGVTASAPISTTQFRNTPSLDGAAQEFWVGGSTPYTNGLWWKQLTPNDSATHFVYDLQFYYVNPDAAQALEFDVNQTAGGQKYIFGTQCNIRDGSQWDVWDNANHVWVRTGKPCPAPAPYVWHHLVWEFARVGGQAVFVAVTLDGVRYELNWAFWQTWEGGSELNVAFQMDGNYAQTPYSVWLDKVTLNTW